MKLKVVFTATLIISIFSACTNRSETQRNERITDSILQEDSITTANEEQRIIDSINVIENEQQLIADSIAYIIEN